MLRTIPDWMIVCSSLSQLLVDSTIKVSALLILALIVTCLLKHDSSATRHMVWMATIGAVLVLPFASTLLPAWRILPKWTTSQQAYYQRDEDSDERSTVASRTVQTVEPIFHEPATREHRIADGSLPVGASPPSDEDAAPQASWTTGSMPQEKNDVTQYPWSLRVTLAGLWGCGLLVLSLRLMAAWRLLQRTEKQSQVVWCDRVDSYRSNRSATNRRVDSAAFAELIDAFIAAAEQLGIRHHITLMFHPADRVPMVWGVFRHRLLLPESARRWTCEHLRSVLLHELAHIQRRDSLAQLMTQITCSLHWFNPLVWFAAGRMHVERESACDDLVLHCGVLPSSYAEHLLSVATSLTASRAMQVCSLAMARRSSLDGRLNAVLCKRQNRRRVSISFASLLLILATAITVPVAMLEAAIQPPASSQDPPTPAGKNDSTEQAPRVEGSPVERPKTAELDWSELEKPVTVHALCTEAHIQFCEQHLDWSEPVNGLRAAIQIRSANEKGIFGKERQIYLVLQNVSNKSIRFCDTNIRETKEPAAEVEGREIYLHRNGVILFGLQNSVSTKTDQVLEPRCLFYINLVESDLAQDRQTKTGDHLAEGIVKDPTQSLSAVLCVDNAPEGAWTGRLKTPASRGAYAAKVLMPSSKEGQALFRFCIDRARLSGKVPGGLIGKLQELVEEFIRNNSGDASGDPYAKKMQPLTARLDKHKDWDQGDVVRLFDDIAAVTTIPLERTLDVIRENTLQRGHALPASMKDSNWGDVLPSGLRMAWILEPHSQEYPLGSALKSRVIIHNSGNEPVMFVTRSFQQPRHGAVTENGAAVKMASTFWTTLGRRESYRLHPGEVCEVYAPGIGIGPRHRDKADQSNVRAGTWLLADEGEQIVFQPGEVLLTGDHNQVVDPDWWPAFINERIRRDAPLPAEAQEREVILFRVVADLFGNSPSPEEAAAFYADMSPQAIENIAQRLSKRSWHKPVTGSIRSGELRFKILPPNPTAAARP
ncbi:MAG: M56 family metallopeptidase [Pirellulales bacterium]